MVTVVPELVAPRVIVCPSTTITSFAPSTRPLTVKVRPVIVCADSMVLAAAVLNTVTAAAFSEGLRLSFTPFQIVYSVIKAVLFGGAIAFFCTYEGYTADVGAEGVGRSTAQAVVITSVAILVLDALTALLLAPYLQA